MLMEQSRILAAGISSINAIPKNNVKKTMLTILTGASFCLTSFWEQEDHTQLDFQFTTFLDWQNHAWMATINAGKPLMKHWSSKIEVYLKIYRWD